MIATRSSSAAVNVFAVLVSVFVTLRITELVPSSTFSNTVSVVPSAASSQEIVPSNVANDVSKVA